MVIYDTHGRPFKYQPVAFDFREKSKIVSEINTNYGKYEGKLLAVHLSFGLDGKSYAYYFENHGFDDYNIYARIEFE